MVEKTTFRELKALLIEMMRGYPEYGYYGKVEFYLKNTKEKSVNLLIRHKIIEELPKKEVKKLQISEEEKNYRWYRLTAKGVDLAISMINLDYNENVKKYNKRMKKLTIWIIILTFVSLGIGILNIFI